MSRGAKCANSFIAHFSFAITGHARIVGSRLPSIWVRRIIICAKICTRIRHGVLLGGTRWIAKSATSRRSRRGPGGHSICPMSATREGGYGASILLRPNTTSRLLWRRGAFFSQGRRTLQLRRATGIQHIGGRRLHSGNRFATSVTSIS